MIFEHVLPPSLYILCLSCCSILVFDFLGSKNWVSSWHLYYQWCFVCRMEPKLNISLMKIVMEFFTKVFHFYNIWLQFHIHVLIIKNVTKICTYCFFVVFPLKLWLWFRQQGQVLFLVTSHLLQRAYNLMADTRLMIVLYVIALLQI